MEAANRDVIEAAGRYEAALLRRRALQAYQVVFSQSAGQQFKWSEFLEFSKKRASQAHGVLSLIDVDVFRVPKYRKLGVISGKLSSMKQWELTAHKDELRELLLEFTGREFRFDIEFI